MFSKHCQKSSRVISLAITKHQRFIQEKIGNSVIRSSAFPVKQIRKTSNVSKCNILSSKNTASVREDVSFTTKTHLCGQLSLDNVGEEVTLCGWLQYFRFKGLFLIIRDWSGIVQVVLDLKKVPTMDIESLTFESVIEVKGVVRKRPEGQENLKMMTGEIEVCADEVNVLNRCEEILPIDIMEHSKSREPLRMEYRYLDIRSDYMQRNLRTRSKMVMKIREFLCNKHGFVDVETPTLFRRTPGGAREFIVPTKNKGKFYTLPQSPQQFKQLLMVGGIDRYFQIAKCYRDEQTRHDRQPEFTQVDIEMSFTTQQDVQDMIEQLLHHSWPEGEITLPFPRITYDEAMEKYGTDKPDTRFDMKLENVNAALVNSGISSFEEILKTENGNIVCMRIPQGTKYFSHNEFKNVIENQDVIKDCEIATIRVNEKNEWKCPFQKYLKEETKQKVASQLNIEPGDMAIIAYGTQYKPHTCLGRLRTIVSNHLQSKGVEIIDDDTFNFLWVTDFPLFLPKEDGDGLESAHHPFTAPHPDDLDLVKTHPEQVRSQHYDLVLNGYEIGGGSIRIHKEQLQRYVLTNILKESTEDLEHLLQALSCGCPPHGGIALGLDRLLAVICKATSIRDVIAFPKGSDGQDLMSKGPASVPNQDLDYYHIQVKS